MKLYNQLSATNDVYSMKLKIIPKEMTSFYSFPLSTRLFEQITVTKEDIEKKWEHFLN